MSEIDNNWKKFQEPYNSDHLFDPRTDIKDSDNEVFMAKTVEEAEKLLHSYVVDKISDIWKQSVETFTHLDQLTDLITQVNEWKLTKTVFKTDEWIATQDKIATGNLNEMDVNTIKQMESSVFEYGLQVDIEQLKHIKSLNNDLNNFSSALNHIICHLSEIISDPNAVEVYERREGDAPF